MNIKKLRISELPLMILWVVPLVAWPSTTDGSLTIKWALISSSAAFIFLLYINRIVRTIFIFDSITALYSLFILVEASHLLNPDHALITIREFYFHSLMFLGFCVIRSIYIPVKKFIWFHLLTGLFVVIYGLMTDRGVHIGNWKAGNLLISTLGNPNFVAEYLLLVAPFIFSCYETIRNIFLKMFLVVYIGLTFYCFYRGNSMGGNLGLVAGLFVYFFMRIFFRIKIVNKMFVTAGIFIILIGFIFLYIASKNDVASLIKGGQKFRVLCWQGTLEMIRTNPLLGFGEGSFKMFYPFYRLQKERVVSSFNRVARPHSDPLHYLCEIGVVGYGIYAALVVCLIYFSIVRINSSPYYMSGYVAAVVGTLIDGLTSMNLHNPAPFLVFTVLTANVFSVSSDKDCTPRKWSYPLWILVALTGFFIGVQILSGDLHTRLGNEHHDFASNHSTIKEKAFGWDKGIMHLVISNDILKNQFLNYYRLGLMYNDRAKYYNDVKEYKRSLLAYQTSAQFAPYYEDYRNNLGVAYRETGDNSQSFASLIASVHINPNYDQAYANLALIFENAGNDNLAIQMYNRAIQNNAEFADVYGNLGTIYFRHNEMDKAEELYRRACEISPNSSIQLTNLGIVLERINKLNESEEIYLKAISLDLNNLKARYGLSTIYIKSNRITRALEILDDGMLNPDDPVGAMINKRRQEIRQYLNRLNKQ